jgi:hypothetical protein
VSWLPEILEHRLKASANSTFFNSRIFSHYPLGVELLANGQLPCRDAFQKREKANEDYAIKQREKEKLLELKKKLSDQQQHLKKLEESM